MPESTRSRTPSSETKEALLAAGRHVLSEKGIQASALGVELAKAIEVAGVPKSSAYRLFAGNNGSPQANFTVELIKSLVTDGVHTDPDVTIEATAAFLAEQPDLFETGTPAELATALRELIRRVSQANGDALADSVEFRVYVMALATAGAGPDAGPIEASLILAEDEESNFLTMYRDLAELFGLRLRKGWTWAMFDAVAGTSSYGDTLRRPFNQRLASLTRATGPNGEDQLWTATGVAFEGAALVALEPNPRVVNAADLSTWLD